jgi:peptidoglycan hydrolase CwlO-like protein
MVGFISKKKILNKVNNQQEVINDLLTKNESLENRVKELEDVISNLMKKDEEKYRNRFDKWLSSYESGD